MPERLSAPPFPQPGPRIAVVGTTGSGKTTVASWLAHLIQAEHIELDALHWGPGWTKPKRDVFRQRVEQALNAPCWVVDGNYREVRDLTWGLADTLVWLDYPLHVVLWQLTWRTLRRIISREVLWNNNRETLRDAFFSKDSLFLYALSSQKRQRSAYPQVLSSSDYTHLQIIHLRSPKEAQEWLERLSKELL
jgi:adenylate kinase family enzyme